jgi:hypothetical protein
VDGVSANIMPGRSASWANAVVLLTRTINMTRRERAVYRAATTQARGSTRSWTASSVQPSTSHAIVCQGLMFSAGGAPVVALGPVVHT